MKNFSRDIRHTFRQWGRAPSFAVVSMLTIAVGAGGTTTMMSVTRSILLRPQPGVQDPEGLVEIRTGDRAGRSGRLMTYSTFEALRDGEVGFEGIAAGSAIQASLSVGPETMPELVAGVAATGNIFSVLGTRPALGRFFSPEEDRDPGTHPVVVLSHRIWIRSFGGEQSVLGRTVSINRVPFTVIGVAEEGFHGHLPLYDFSLFLPFSMFEALTGQLPREARVATVGRLGPGSSIDRVRAGADRLADEQRRIDPTEWVSAVFVVEPHTESYQEIRGPVSLFLGFLLALSGCILLIACANLAGLLLSRAVAREHEVAVRRAMGASRGRLLTQLLTETSLLFSLGGAAGCVLAFGATWILGRVRVPGSIPFLGEYAPDGSVLAASMAVTLTVGLLFGLAPALRATRPDLASVLRDNRGQCPGGHWLRKLFVLTQVAGSVALLGGSGLLFKALRRAEATELGFEPRWVHVATVNLGIQQYAEEEGRLFFARLLEGGAALPGVESAALSDFVFLSSPPRRSGSFSTTDGEGRVIAGLFGVSPEFFSTTGVKILEGRPFEATDASESEPVAIVNQRVAEILWPGAHAVGQVMRTGESLLRVVGVAESGKYISIGETGLAGVFRPLAQSYSPITSLLLKAGPGTPDLRSPVRQLVRDLDPFIPLTDNASHTELIGGQLLPRRAAAAFAGTLGFLGVFLAAVGLYGVLSFLVRQRAPELAVRVALGAHPSAVRRSVILSGLGLVLAGFLLGLPLAAAISSLARRFLYGLGPMDPGILAGIAILFGAVGTVASLFPALQATRTDPSRVLREG